MLHSDLTNECNLNLMSLITTTGEKSALAKQNKVMHYILITEPLFQCFPVLWLFFQAGIEGILSDTEETVQLLDARPASHHHTHLACLAVQQTNMAAAGVGCSQIICSS